MKLSIITINFNNASGLHKTIESVINQVFSDYEYIIIDAGSNDGSVEVIQKYADKITYWVSEPDNGIYHAMNKGIKQAKGEYLLFLNSGDVLSVEDVLKKFLNSNPTEDLLYGGTFFSVDNKIVSETTYPSTLTGMELFEYTINHQSAFFRADIFKTFKYDTTYTMLADWALMLDLIFKERISYRRLDFYICVYDFTGYSSRPENSKIMEQERFRYLEDNSNIFIPHLIRSYFELFKKYEKLNASMENTLIRKLIRKFKAVLQFK